MLDPCANAIASAENDIDVGKSDKIVVVQLSHTTVMTPASTAKCNCTNTDTLDALLADPDPTSLEAFLKQERLLHHIRHVMQSCLQCSGDLDRHLNLLKQIKRLPAMSVDTGRTSDLTFLGDRSMSCESKQSSVRVGMLELDEEDSGLVGRLVVKQSLLRMQGMVHEIQTRAQTLYKNGPSPEMRHVFARVAEVDCVAEEILAAIWKAIARQTLARQDGPP